ncbi:MAG: glutaredoxin family protein [Burkholderiales bacterium]|nr:glutaredoxin family protein [Burkholderiales bacterium]
MFHFVLYSRSYCHLCQDMLDALHSYADRYAFEVEVLDVDAAPELLEKYDELVPVLAGRKQGDSDLQQICHYFLDDSKLKAFFHA